MKHPIWMRGGAVLLSIWLAASAAAPGCASANDDIILPSESGENEAFVSGDYTYSLLIDAEDESWQAVCIESYTGSEANLVIPAELDGMEVVGLGDRAFTSMQGLQTVTLPSTLTILGTYSFANCTRLTAFEVEEGNPVFESRDGVLYAEEGTSLVRYPVGTLPAEITIPDGVVTIGNAAFTACVSLSRIMFPDTLEYIGKSAFSDCPKLTEVTLPDSLAEIGDFAFNNCENLKKVIFPDALSTIGAAAFAATAIESVDLPDSLLTVGEQAFAATEMKEVTIPSSVTEIGYAAFGWDVDIYNELYMDSDFVIYGVAGSEAESYASDFDFDNDFRFEAIEAEADESSAAAEAAEPEPDADSDKPSGAVRIIGIAVCCVLLVVIAVVAVLSGKKEPAEQNDSAEPEKEEPNDES